MEAWSAFQMVEESLDRWSGLKVSSGRNRDQPLGRLLDQDLQQGDSTEDRESCGEKMLRIPHVDLLEFLLN